MEYRFNDIEVKKNDIKDFGMYILVWFIVMMVR